MGYFRVVVVFFSCLLGMVRGVMGEVFCGRESVINNLMKLSDVVLLERAYVSILEHESGSLLVPRRSSEERKRNHQIAIRKQIEQYIKNGSQGNLNLNGTPVADLRFLLKYFAVQLLLQNLAPVLFLMILQSMFLVHSSHGLGFERYVM